MTSQNASLVPFDHLVTLNGGQQWQLRARSDNNSVLELLSAIERNCKKLRTNVGVHFLHCMLQTMFAKMMHFG
jgi:hypothetical protein